MRSLWRASDKTSARFRAETLPQTWMLQARNTTDSTREHERSTLSLRRNLYATIGSRGGCPSAFRERLGSSGNRYIDVDGRLISTGSLTQT